MILRKTLLLFLLILACLIIPFDISSAEPQVGVPEITGINVEKAGDITEIQIESNFPVPSYTIYNPEDPYKVVVELQGIAPGNLKDKMVIDKAGVAEILISKVEGAVKTVRLDITLTVPADIKPVQKGKALVFAFRNLEAEEVAEAPAKELPVIEAQKEPEPSAAKAGVIEDIELVKSADKVDVLIHGDGSMSPKVFEIEGNKLIVDIPDVTTKIDSYKAYESPVAGIRIGKHSDKTRIVFDLMESAKYHVSTEDKQIRVSFEKPQVKVAKAEEAPAPEKSRLIQDKAEIPAPEKSRLIRDKEAAAAHEPAPFITKEYTGEKISIDFQDADLIHIFRLIADVSGYNIVVSPQVKGKFSMKLINVPWDQALDIILRNYGLSRAVEGKIIRIAPTSDIAQEEENIAKAKEAALKSGDLETRIYKLNYAEVKKIEKVIKDAKIMSLRGYFSIDERTSTVVLRDVPNIHSEFEQLIKSLDLPTPQVNVEAKIVEVSTNFTKDLGVQWGALWRPSDMGGRVTIAGVPSTGTGSITNLAGSNPSGNTTGYPSNNPLMVNLPAAVGSGSGGALGLGYISAANNFILDLQLSAMESTGKGKIISNPRITTLDNHEAKIQQGKKIPYSTTSSEGTKTEWTDATLELTVIPHITPDGTVVMNVEIKKNEADFSRTSGGVPTIDTKEAKTQVLIKNGDTLVIGGIFKTTISKAHAGIPGFSKIPILGWLFKKELDKEETTELLIFITPRIVKDM
ncbi:MAG: type IV pilus secretin PilQ [Thermodesulfovibrionia bacterium]|nr:type IV pilus secretin PilQ [Thermodesulfovibrionia bacterium]